LKVLLESAHISMEDNGKAFDKMEANYKHKILVKIIFIFLRIFFSKLN